MSPANVSVESLKVVGVVGAGQMGSGIAQVAASTGRRVLLTDVIESAAVRGKEKIAQALGRVVEKGKLSAADRDALLARIEPVNALDAFAQADVVIEAVTESESLKLELFEKLDKICSPGVILATNTSSIPITKIAAVTKRAEKVIGMHFMNPPPLMRLVEVVRGLQTSDETYETIKALAEAFGKTAVTASDQPGFIVNRVLIPMLNEACFALGEGLGSIEDIDKAVKLGLNHPMGPFELADLIGLDICLAIANVLYKEIGDPKYRPAPVLRSYVHAGWLGRKSGRGFYKY